MSTAEEPPEDAGWQLVDEVERARLEDPSFAIDHAKALAKARGESYTPEKHGPHPRSIVPRMARIAETKPLIDVEALLARFNARAPLKLVPKSDRRVVDIRDYKSEASGDR